MSPTLAPVSSEPQIVQAVIIDGPDKGQIISLNRDFFTPQISEEEEILLRQFCVQVDTMAENVSRLRANVDAFASRLEKAAEVFENGDGK